MSLLRPRPSPAKVILAVVVAMLTTFSVLGHWLLLSHLNVWVYYSSLIIVGVYLIRVASRERSSLVGLVLALMGLAVLAYGVSFSNVVALTTGTQQLAWLIPPDSGIRLGDGFTLEFYTDSYTYYVNTLGVLTGYFLFVAGLWLIDFEKA